MCCPCPVWDVSPTLADRCHTTAEMGGQQIQGLWLERADISLGQFTLTMSLSLKTGCYPPPKLKWFIGEVLHDHSVLVAVCRGNARLSSDVWFVCSGSEVELKYAAFMIKFMKHAASKILDLEQSCKQSYESCWRAVFFLKAGVILCFSCCQVLRTKWTKR